MKSWTKRIVLSASVAVLSFVLISFSCAKTPVKGTAGTVYAESDSGEIVSKESLKVIEALQNSFRSISNRLLPAVVEVDVIETKTVTDPFQDFRHFFFGMPEQEEQGKKRQYEQKGLGSGVIVRRTGDTIYVLTSSNKLGYNIYTETQQIPEEDVISSIISGMSLLYGITIPSFDFVNYKNIKIIRDNSTFSVHSGGSGQHHFSYTICNLDYTTTYDNNMIHFAVDNTISDLRVNIRNYKINYYYNTSTDTSSCANGSYYYFGSTEYERTTDFFNGQPNIEYYLDQEKVNCVNEGESGINTTSVANKQVLFGSSETPYKYLTDFTKLLNLKYDYDKVNKVINILTEDKYYKNDIIDLSKDIDYSKQIKIIPTNTNTKWKELSLKNIDSYPNYLYSKKFVIPYGGYKYNTKYEFNADTENLFKDNIYKELIPYQLSTQFMNDTKGYPSILAAGTYDYTLYKNGEIGGDENTETINVTNTVNAYNFTPNTEKLITKVFSMHIHQKLEKLVT